MYARARVCVRVPERIPGYLHTDFQEQLPFPPLMFYYTNLSTGKQSHGSRSPKTIILQEKGVGGTENQLRADFQKPYSKSKRWLGAQ